MTRLLNRTAFYAVPGNLFSLTMLLFLLAGCGGSPELESKRRDREIVIDGQLDDWAGAVSYMEKENVAIGIFNDNEFLYLCLSSGEPKVRTQIITRGMTLWLDAQGKKNKNFGIRFPLGMMELMGGEFRGMRRGGESAPDQDLQKLEENFAASLTEIEILGPEKEDKRRLARKAATGIEVDARLASGTLVYEIKIPLVKSDRYPYAIGTADKIIGVGVETAEINMEEMREQMRERMGGRGGMGGGRGGMGGGRGGMGGGRGGMGGGRGGMGGGQGGGMPGGREMPEPLKAWAKVKLASGDSASSGI